jgi:hypothetical protein
MRDLAFAFRMVRKNPAFSLTVILLLALCIGANTAVLSVVNAALIRPLPYPQPDRLAAVVTVFRGQDFEGSVDGATWELVRDRVTALDPAVWSGTSGVNMGVNGAGVYLKQQQRPSRSEDS